VKLHPVGNNV